PRRASAMRKGARAGQGSRAHAACPSPRSWKNATETGPCSVLDQCRRSLGSAAPQAGTVLPELGDVSIGVPAGPPRFQLGPDRFLKLVVPVHQSLGGSRASRSVAQVSWHFATSAAPHAML